MLEFLLSKVTSVKNLLGNTCVNTFLIEKIHWLLLFSIKMDETIKLLTMGILLDHERALKIGCTEL